MTSHAELEHLWQRLSDEGEKTADFFAGLAPQAWEAPVYSTGPGWHVRQVLAHFVSAERSYLHYMRDTVNGGAGVPRDFDIDGFNAVQVEALSGLTPPQLIESFRDIRRGTCDFVASIKPLPPGSILFPPWFAAKSC